MVEGITVSDEVVNTIVKLVRSTREDPWSKELDQPASVRAGLTLYEKVQALALLQGDNKAKVEDIKRVATSALGSRVKPSPESKYYDDPFGFIEELTAKVLEEVGV